MGGAGGTSGWGDWANDASANSDSRSRSVRMNSENFDYNKAKLHCRRQLETMSAH